MNKKEYSNMGRKPMMAGGMAMGRLKRQQGTPAGQGGERTMSDADVRANADTQSRLATGRATQADRDAADRQRMEELNRMSTADLKKLANAGNDDAMMAVSILRKRGEAGAMPSGDPEGGMMYGGKAKKKKK